MFVSCGNEITEGQVYEKVFVPAHTETRLIPIITYNDKTVNTILIPQIKHIPDRWYIKIKAVGSGEDEECEKVTYSVTEEIFNQYEVGDFYSNGMHFDAVN